MVRIFLALAICVIGITFAQAQQSPQDQLNFLGKAAGVLQQQRNAQADAAVNAEARAIVLAEQLQAALKDKVELEAKVKDLESRLKETVPEKQP